MIPGAKFNMMPERKGSGDPSIPSITFSPSEKEGIILELMKKNPEWTREKAEVEFGNIFNRANTGVAEAQLDKERKAA